MKTVLTAILVLLVSGWSLCIAQAQEASITWYTIEEAQKLNKKKPKKIFIDFYTSWCGWCKHMDATTFKEPVVVDLMNRYFYPIKFNAEMKDTIVFDGVQLTNKYPSNPRSAHDLTIKYASNYGRLGYPSFTFMGEDLKRLELVQSYLKPAHLEAYLKYYGQNHHKTIKWEDYLSQFASDIAD